MTAPLMRQAEMTSPLFSPRGEAKCVRGLSVRGTGRLAPHFLRKEVYLNSTVSTAGNRNEVVTGLSRASTGRW